MMLKKRQVVGELRTSRNVCLQIYYVKLLESMIHARTIGRFINKRHCVDLG